MKKVLSLVLCLVLVFVFMASVPAAAEASPVITRAWTSDSIGGPEVTHFPAGSETVHVNYDYENPAGSVHKIVWYDQEETFLRTATHVTEYETGYGTWSLTNSVFLSGGRYIADLFINDILLASVSWTVDPAPPMITRAWTSESVRGQEVIVFPTGTEKVYINYDYINPLGSVQKIIWYDSERNALGTLVHEAEHRVGTGTWHLTYPDEAFWPAGSYSADLFINDIVLGSVNWSVGQPPVLLVHGFQREEFNPAQVWRDMAKDLTGKDVYNRPDWDWVYDESKPFNPDFAMKRLEGSGFVVYISNYTHDPPLGTPLDIRWYAQSLSDEINMIKQHEGTSMVDVVAHSMGGLVTRAYIESEDFTDNGTSYNYDIRKLVMLGTPNYGVDLDLLREFFGEVTGLRDWPSVKDMLGETSFLAFLNGNGGVTGASQGVEYSAIAGYTCDHCYLTTGVGALWLCIDECHRQAEAGQGNDGWVEIESVKLPEIAESRWFVYYLEHSGLRIHTSPLVKHILLSPHFGNEPIAMSHFYSGDLGSDGELRLRDSQGRITGLVGGEVKEEIPNSTYNDETDKVVVFSEDSSYIWEVVGTSEGTYGLQISHTQSDGMATFIALDIPTAPGATHMYEVDWDALAQGEEGVTVQIDSDGDGIFEETISADNAITHDEFMLETETTVDFDPDTLDLKSKGKFVTVYIELPQGYDLGEIDVSSIMLNEVVPALDKPTEIADHDGNRVPDLMVKFDRTAVQEILTQGDQVEIGISGKAAGIDFEGDHTIRVINR